MEVTELRIGNYVGMFIGHFDDGPKYINYKIQGVKEELGSYYYKIDDTWIFKTQNLVPLPITNTLLKKLGFVWLREDEPYCYDESFDFRLYDNGHVVFKGVVLHDVVVKNVHELQNLYYSLSKIELSWDEN